MATDNIGLAVASRRGPLYPATIVTSGMKEGAAVVYDTTNQNGVKAPGAEKASGFAGLIADVQGSSGTAANSDVNLQRTGIGMGLLAASASCTRGVGLVIANTSGHLRGYVDGTDHQCDVVGTAEVTKTAGAGGAESIPVNLDAFFHADAA